jgi:excisionase family DNA binding protein
MREIMTPQQVAEFLQLNTDTVLRLIRANELVATRVGRTYRIHKEELETFIMTHSNKAQVREAMFNRVLSIADRNPGVSSDDILDELEAMDREGRQPQAK